MKKEDKQIPIFVIVLAFCFFMPPLGVLLMGLRFNQNKKGLHKSGQTMLWVSIIFFVLFFVFALVDTPELSDWLFSAYFFGLGSMIALVFAVILLHQANLQDKYKIAIEEDKLTDLTAIASSVGVIRENAIKHLRKMITDGIFPDAKVDVPNGIFILKAIVPDEELVKAIKCKSCGATIVAVINKDTICEYCGSPVAYSED